MMKNTFFLKKTKQDLMSGNVFDIVKKTMITQFEKSAKVIGKLPDNGDILEYNGKKFIWSNGTYVETY